MMGIMSDEDVRRYKATVIQNEIDPAMWPRLIDYLKTLPRVETVEPDDVEPFV